MPAKHDTLATQVSVEEIEHNWIVYLRRVEAGETLFLVRAGRVVAEIKPTASRLTSLRPYGLCAGEFIVPDDFDAPLPINIIQEFEGG